MRKTRLVAELLPQLQIAILEAEGQYGSVSCTNSSPLAGEARWEGAQKSEFSGQSMAPSPNPSREGRGIPAVLLDPATLFSFKPKEIWLEIGFGGGEHLSTQALNNPAIGMIGCEPFLNGVASLLEHIDDNKIHNVRILPDDARKLLDVLPEASIDRCFVLFADPWPKAKHVERRFIGPNNIPRLSRMLKSGAELRLATDDANLASWMTEVMDSAADFTRVFHGTTQPADWVVTRYEEKGIKAGRVPVYMGYTRKDRV